MQAAPAGAAPSAAAAAPAGGYTDVPVSQIKRITAARLLESKQTIPHYYLTMECDVTALSALRTQINDSLAAGGAGAPKLSVNDFIVKAAALALRKVGRCDAAGGQACIAMHYFKHMTRAATRTPFYCAILFAASNVALPIAIPRGRC